MFLPFKCQGKRLMGMASLATIVNHTVENYIAWILQRTSCVLGGVEPNQIFGSQKQCKRCPLNVLTV